MALFRLPEPVNVLTSAFTKLFFIDSSPRSYTILMPWEANSCVSSFCSPRRWEKASCIYMIIGKLILLQAPDYMKILFFHNNKSSIISITAPEFRILHGTNLAQKTIYISILSFTFINNRQPALMVRHHAHHFLNLHNSLANPHLYLSKIPMSWNQRTEHANNHTNSLPNTLMTSKSAFRLVIHNDWKHGRQPIRWG